MHRFNRLPGLLIGPLVGLSLLLTGCGSGERQPSRAASDAGAVPPPATAQPAPDDSLALTTAAGTELWYTLARTSQDAAGAPCVERGLEIRRDDAQIPVPLLYTRDRPVPVNDTTVRVRLWTDCRAGPAYLVNLRTGQPIPAPDGGP